MEAKGRDGDSVCYFDSGDGFTVIFVKILKFIKSDIWGVGVWYGGQDHI